jgi:hypothetical protein
MYDDTSIEPWSAVAWLQGGYSLSEFGLDFQLDVGRYIDSDTGVRASVTRRWDYGSIGFWVIRTDHRLEDDKITNAGVNIELPMETWLSGWPGSGSISPTLEHDVSIVSTWRGDAARVPGTGNTPDQFLQQFRPIELKKNVEMILEEYCSYDDIELEKTEYLGLTDFLKKH